MAASGGSVLVLNSGSSSVKFALIAAGTGERVLGGLAEQVGTPEAVLRIRRPAGDATEPLPDGSRRPSSPASWTASPARTRISSAPGTGWCTGASGSATRSWSTTR